ncbi:MAG: GTP pyrophosphokinase family protein [Bacteroidales bacterium]|nr:GTP pyrophosphokinase family protein [Bacteroidales bacterium]
MNNEKILNKAIANSNNVAISITSFYNSAVQFQQLLMFYDCAIKQVSTKLDILKSEFTSKNKRNPICSVSNRIKEPISILEKTQRLNINFSIDNIITQINDIAGIRVICPFIDDVYFINNFINNQEDIDVVETKDYILNPKKSGYRSLHLIVKVSVCFSDKIRKIPVEIQIRTIAMDFWACLEHQIHYKKDFKMPKNIDIELKEIAQEIANTDNRMLKLAKSIINFED